MPEFTSCLQNAYEFLRFTQVSGGSWWCLSHAGYADLAACQSPVGCVCCLLKGWTSKVLGTASCFLLTVAGSHLCSLEKTLARPRDVWVGCLG